MLPERKSEMPMSDVEAHHWAMSLPISEVVKKLVDLLGATTVAAIAGVSETRAVNQWIVGRMPQKPHVLRFTLQIASMIAQGGDHENVQAWFQGSNPHLEDAIPALMLRDSLLQDVQGPLMAAARSFANHQSNPS